MTSPRRARVLVVDDEKTFRLVAEAALVAEGLEVATAGSGREGLEQFRAFGPDLVVLDRNLPDADGLDVLARLRADAAARGAEEPLVVMATAYADIDNAVQALRLGAHDYLTKPLQLPDLVVTVKKALEARRQRNRADALSGEGRRRFDRGVVLGESPAMRRVLELVDKVAQSPTTTVLIEGESGTGKEVVANLIHYRTPSRAAQPLVELNCAAVPEALLESELFGSEKGAFTDARATRRGLVEEADGGSLFLDEIGELSIGTQAKLLRVLETSEFRRLGATRDQSVDVRFMAATNRDLAQAVAAGAFRLDLFHRLDVFRIRVPPLRERREDVLPLARFFLEELARRMQKAVARLSPGVEQRLLAYAWPGNVRELRNVLERAVIVADAEVLQPAEIVLGDARGGHAPPATPWAAEAVERSLASDGRPPTLVELERDYLVRLLEHTGGNRSQVARLMGVSYPTVMKKVTDYGVDLSRWTAKEK